MVDPITVVGVVGGEVFGAAACDAIAQADVLLGSPRHLEHFPEARAEFRIDLAGALDPLIEQLADHQTLGRQVCVLSSGDPGFFGITRLLVARFGRQSVRVLPAPSSVALAWAAAGLTWDDAAVVSAHGRSLDDAVARASHLAKVAVLTSPSNSPEVLGRALRLAGCGPRRVVVASRLGEPDERIVDTDLDGLSAGQFDPMSVVLLMADDHAADAMSLSWGGDEARFAQRPGMITKSEVRAIALSKLDLPPAGVLWDVGAGSGSVGVEAATIRRGLRVFAIERVETDAMNIATNARAFGVATSVDVIVGAAPAACVALPDPDRVFVGGGGIDVLRSCWDRLRPGGVLVATFVVLDRAVEVANMLGSMVQVHVDRCVAIGNAGLRLEPTNPVFICWGSK